MRKYIVHCLLNKKYWSNSNKVLWGGIIMEYSGTWKEIWTQKGAMEGTKEDIRIYDGWEKSTADMEETAAKIIKLLDIKSTDRVLE